MPKAPCQCSRHPGHPCRDFADQEDLLCQTCRPRCQLLDLMPREHIERALGPNLEGCCKTRMSYCSVMGISEVDDLGFHVRTVYPGEYKVDGHRDSVTQALYGSIQAAEERARSSGLISDFPDPYGPMEDPPTQYGTA